MPLPAAIDSNQTWRLEFNSKVRRNIKEKRLKTIFDDYFWLFSSTTNKSHRLMSVVGRIISN